MDIPLPESPGIDSLSETPNLDIKKQLEHEETLSEGDIKVHDKNYSPIIIKGPSEDAGSQPEALGNLPEDQKITPENITLFSEPEDMEDLPINMKDIPEEEISQKNMKGRQEEIEFQAINIKEMAEEEALPMKIKFIQEKMEIPPANVADIQEEIEVPSINMKDMPEEIEVPLDIIEVPPEVKQSLPESIQILPENIEFPPDNMELPKNCPKEIKHPKKQDQMSGEVESSILDIPVPTFSTQYSPSVPNEDEILETTHDVLDISLPEGPGIGSILPSKSVVKKRLISMLKQTAAKKYKSDSREERNKEKLSPKESKKKKKTLSAALVQARNTISEIEELKRRENEVREVMHLSVESFKKRESLREKKVSKTDEDAINDYLEARERSEERDRRERRERRRQRENDRDPVKTKNWKEFNKHGYSIFHFRRIKSKWDNLDKPRKYRDKEKERVNLLDTSKRLLSIKVVRGKNDRDIDFPSWGVKTTRSHPSLEYSYNPRYDTSQFQSRQQLVASLPDDILSIAKQFLEGKRPVSGREIKKDCVDTRRRKRDWYAKEFLSETIINRDYDDENLNEEKEMLGIDIEGRWKDGSAVEMKSPNDIETNIQGPSLKNEEIIPIDIEGRWRDETVFGIKSLKDLANDPKNNELYYHQNKKIIGVDIEGRWKDTPPTEDKSINIQESWKENSPLKNISPDRHENPEVGSQEQPFHQSDSHLHSEEKDEDTAVKKNNDNKHMNLTALPVISSERINYLYDLSEKIDIDLPLNIKEKVYRNSVGNDDIDKEEKVQRQDDSSNSSRDLNPYSTFSSSKDNSNDKPSNNIDNINVSCNTFKNNFSSTSESFALQDSDKFTLTSVQSTIDETNCESNVDNSLKENLVSEYEEFMKMVQMDEKTKGLSPDTEVLDNQISNIIDEIHNCESPKAGETEDDDEWSKTTSMDQQYDKSLGQEKCSEISEEKGKEYFKAEVILKKATAELKIIKKKKRMRSDSESSVSSTSSSSSSSSTTSTSSSSTSSSSGSSSSSSSSSSDSSSSSSSSSDSSSSSSLSSSSSFDSDSDSDSSVGEKKGKKKKKPISKKKNSIKNKIKEKDVKMKDRKNIKKKKRESNKKLSNEKEKTKGKTKDKMKKKKPIELKNRDKSDDKKKRKKRDESDEESNEDSKKLKAKLKSDKAKPNLDKQLFSKSKTKSKSRNVDDKKKLKKSKVGDSHKKLKINEKSRNKKQKSKKEKVREKKDKLNSLESPKKLLQVKDSKSQVFGDEESIEADEFPIRILKTEDVLTNFCNEFNIQSMKGELHDVKKGDEFKTCGVELSLEKYIKKELSDDESSFSSQSLAKFNKKHTEKNEYSPNKFDLALLKSKNFMEDTRESITFELPLPKTNNIKEDSHQFEIPLPEDTHYKVDNNQFEVPIPVGNYDGKDIRDSDVRVISEKDIPYDPSYTPDSHSTKDISCDQWEKPDIDSNQIKLVDENNKQSDDNIDLRSKKPTCDIKSIDSSQNLVEKLPQIEVEKRLVEEPIDKIYGMKKISPDGSKQSEGEEAPYIPPDSERYSPGLSEDDDEEEDIPNISALISPKAAPDSKSPWSETGNSVVFSFPKQSQDENSKGSYISLENIPLPSADSSCIELRKDSPAQSLVSELEPKDSNSSSTELNIKKNPAAFSPEKDSNAQHASPHSFKTMKLPIARLTFEKQVVKIKQSNIFSDEDSDLEISENKVKDIKSSTLEDNEIKSDLVPKLKSDSSNFESTTTLEPESVPTTKPSATRKSRWLSSENPENENIVLKEHKIAVPSDIDKIYDEIPTLNDSLKTNLNLSSGSPSVSKQTTSEGGKPATVLKGGDLEEINSEISVKASARCIEKPEGIHNKDDDPLDSHLLKGKDKNIENVTPLWEEINIPPIKGALPWERSEPLSPSRSTSPFRNRSYQSPLRMNPSRDSGSISPPRRSQAINRSIRKSPSRRSPYWNKNRRSPLKRSPVREGSHKVSAYRSPSWDKNSRPLPKRSSSRDRYRKSPYKDKYRKSDSKERYRKSPLRDRYRKSPSRDKYRKSPSKEIYASPTRYRKSPTKLSPLSDRYHKSPSRRSPFRDKPKSPLRRSPSWREKNPDSSRSPMREFNKNKSRRWDKSPKYYASAKRISRSRSPDQSSKQVLFHTNLPLETLVESPPSKINDMPEIITSKMSSSMDNTTNWEISNTSVKINTISGPVKLTSNNNLINITPHKYSESNVADSTSHSELNEAMGEDERRMSLDERIRLELGVDVLSEQGQGNYNYDVLNQDFNYYQDSNEAYGVRGVSSSNLISLTDWGTSPAQKIVKPKSNDDGIPDTEQISSVIPNVTKTPPNELANSQNTDPVNYIPSVLSPTIVPESSPTPAQALVLEPHLISASADSVNLVSTDIPEIIPSSVTPLSGALPVVTPVSNISLALSYSRAPEVSQQTIPLSVSYVPKNKPEGSESTTPSALDPLIQKFFSNLQPGSKSLPLPVINDDFQGSPTITSPSPSYSPTIPITLKKFVKDKTEAILKRKEEKEKRKKDREMRHLKRQQKLDRKLQRQRALLKEGFIKSSDIEEEEQEPSSSYLQDPSYLDLKINVLTSDLYPPAGRSILCYSGFGLDGGKNNEGKKKSVSFADGIKPGEGSSPLNMHEEHRLSPPPNKTGGSKKKRKVKVRIVRMGDEEGWSPPPPPPGTPPPEAYYTYCTVDGFIYSTIVPNASEVVASS